MMTESCGPVIISTQKDGWTHAVDAANGKPLWSFPKADLPFRCGDGTAHSDSKYMRSGAAWRDVYVTMTGGEDMPISVARGYRRLHAFNVCAKEPESPLRWMIDLVPSAVECDVADRGGGNYCLGNPTITRGIVYIGTDHGHLMVLADPDVAKADGRRCANPDVESKDCESLDYLLVPQPKVLANVQLEGSMAYTEPALANGKVYVSTDAGDHGYVYMLQP
jgi:outer membrane protein assembly factor BamB